MSDDSSSGMAAANYSAMPEWQNGTMHLVAAFVAIGLAILLNYTRTVPLFFVKGISEIEYATHSFNTINH